jgi:hypothetical protein
MNVHATNGQLANATARRLLCLAASILGLLVLTFGVAPGTVLASSATDIYTEEPPPVTPNTNNGGNNGGTNNNGGNSNSGNNGSSTGNDDSDSDYSGSGDDTGTGSGDDKYKSGKKYSNGGYNPATDSDEKSGKKAGKDDSDDSTINAATAGGDDNDDGGGSALPLIIAILIGVPLIGAGGYYGWTRYRSGDDETKDRLKSALKGGKPTGTS